MKQLRRLPEFLRFVLVGVFATALHYGIYFLLQKFINVNIAYTLGYAFSFIANFYLTAYFTFGKKPSKIEIGDEAEGIAKGVGYIDIDELLQQKIDSIVQGGCKNAYQDKT